RRGVTPRRQLAQTKNEHCRLRAFPFEAPRRRSCRAGTSKLDSPCNFARGFEIRVLTNGGHRKQQLFERYRRLSNERCFEQGSMLGFGGTAVLRCPALERSDDCFRDIADDQLSHLLSLIAP